MSDPPFWSFKGRRFAAIVGSRQAPQEALQALRKIGYTYAEHNVAITSGDATGCDSAGLEGAMSSERFPMVGARIYLPWNGVRKEDGSRRFADNRIFFDASKFENYEQAQAIAKEARGSFEGLKRGGIALHTRNSYQVLLDDLKTPVTNVVCWAKPVGRKGAVQGGTNTAVQIALKYKIPVINLATDEGWERAQTFISRYYKDPS